jgi:hypothetical protein
LALALKTNAATLRNYGSKKPPSASVAIRAARLANVSLEDVLASRWPVAGACPHCGKP